MGSVAIHINMHSNPKTGEYVRGPWLKGIYNRPELQRLFRKMTNNEMCRWHRAKCPTDTNHPIFDAAHRRIQRTVEEAA